MARVETAAREDCLLRSRQLGSGETSRGLGEPPCGPEQECPVLRRALTIEPGHSQFIASRLVGGGSFQDLLDRDAERAGDPHDVASELARSIGLPLGYGASTDSARDCQLILREAACPAQDPYSRADRVGIAHLSHDGSVSELA